jgi:hypothetical protein
MTESENTLLPAVVSKLEAAEEYFKEHGGSAGGLASIFDVPVQDLVRYAEDNNWLKKRRKFVAVQFSLANDDYKMFVAANRVPMLEKHLATCQVLQNKLDECMLQIATTDRGADVKLERMSRALKSLIDSTSRILSVTENGIQDAPRDGAGMLILQGAHPIDVTSLVTVKGG